VDGEVKKTVIKGIYKINQGKVKFWSHEQQVPAFKSGSGEPMHVEKTQSRKDEGKQL